MYVHVQCPAMYVYMLCVEERTESWLLEDLTYGLNHKLINQLKIKNTH